MPNLLELPHPFFPNPVFAWTSVGLLVAAVGVAAYTDTSRAKVPNPLVVATLAVGLILNVVRGAWQAGVGHPSWLFGDTDQMWLGAVDGLLFSLAGFVVGFGVCFVFWILGLMRGGDTKLFAALGGWVGLLHLGFLWVLSVAALWVWMIGKVLSGGLRPRKVHATMKQLQQANNVASEPAEQPARAKKMRMTYSAPIAVAALGTSLWLYRAELLLVPAKTVPPPDTTGANPDDPPSRAPTK